VLVEVLVAAPIETVWKALREKDEIRRWFGWEYAGAEDELTWIVTSGQIASEADRVIHIQGMSDRFVLEPRGDRTMLRVIRSAPADGPEGKGWTGIYDDTIEGWTSFIHMLRLMLELHPGEDRRTLYFSGDGRGDRWGGLVPLGESGGIDRRQLRQGVARGGAPSHHREVAARRRHRVDLRVWLERRGARGRAGEVDGVVARQLRRAGDPAATRLERSPIDAALRCSASRNNIESLPEGFY
jgi:hypothetical protein